MEALKHTRSDATGMEVFKLKTPTGFAILFRDVDADETVDRRNYPEALEAKADAYFAKLEGHI